MRSTEELLLVNNFVTVLVEVVQFERKSSFHPNNLNLGKVSGMKPFSGTWKHTNQCNNATSMTIEPKFAQVCYLMHTFLLLIL